MERTRFAAVAGQFYPLDPAELEGSIADMLDPSAEDIIDSRRFKAFILPHSSYKQCGVVMGAGYAKLLEREIDEVFVMSGTHFHQAEGVIMSDFSRWETPLGYVEESHRRNQIAGSDDSAAQNLIQQDNDPFDGEHAIEVHLPVLQYLWGEEFRFLPLIIGKGSPRLAANSLVKFIDPDDLIICSSELSHGYPADYAKDIDKRAIDSILKLDVDAILHDSFKAFSINSIATLVEIARLKVWKAELLMYKNSSEFVKNDSKTSGYVAIGFY
ncbi:MAG: AmmeMemoRadiSam system protein B [Candidatus Dojkabacteria bacterium]|nr:MAG: AmmeMemoRadiSam system protein B [Candidatus Dojkabacteria bacterium]